jgi:two-component system, OmpR family, sensor kinase
MISLRNIAMFWTTILLVIVTCLAILASRALAVIETNKLLDDELQQIALNAGGRLAPAAHQLISRMEAENRISVEVWDSDGKSIFENPAAVRIPRQAELGFKDIDFDGNEWRVYTATDGKRTALAAQRWSARTEVVNHTALAAAVPVFAALPIGWIVIILGVNALLKRFSKFSLELAARGVEARDPIAAENMPQEVVPLIDAMNELIGRHRSAVEQQKRFLADAAHELRTPLAALQIQIDNFRNQPSVTVRGEIFNELAAGIQRASAMLRQLMRMARLDDQPESPASRPIDLKDLVVSVVSQFVQPASARNIELEMEIDESLATTVADGDIRFLFTNLIDNAIRYSATGGNVKIVLCRDGSDTRVEVKDMGIGIPAEALSRIFDRFYRAAPADIEGTGLGLAIARKIADRYHFDLSIANRTDSKGVCASVVIPAAA